MEKKNRITVPNDLSQDIDAFPSFLVSSDGVPFFSQIDWQLTPKAVRIYILYMHSQLEALKRQVALLEARLDSNSSNSNKPPSSDSPYKRKPKKEEQRQTGSQKKGIKDIVK